MINYHGLTTGVPFWVISMYDSEGYHSSCKAHLYEDVILLAASKSLKMTYTSIPFKGNWDNTIPDVTQYKGES